MSDLFLGIDSGTQGTKGVLFREEDGSMVKEAYAPHTIVEESNGKREQDPKIWVEACEKVFQELFADKVWDPKSVKAIGVSAQQHGMVPLDEEGRVIRPSKLWCDTETSAEAEALTHALGGPKGAIEKTGNSIAVGFTASKVLWMKEHEPENYAKLKTVLLPHDYLNFWLTGERKAEAGDASGTAYYDVRERRYADSVVEALDPSGKLKEALPPVIESDAPVGAILPEIASQFGFGRDVIVSSGGGDNMIAALGTGNVAPGIVTASIGTSGTIYAFSETPVVDPKGEIAAFCSSDGHWLPLVCTMNATVSSELWRGVFELDLDTFNRELAAAKPGAGGLTIIPFYNGERTPALPQASGSLLGMKSENLTRANICRASVEGATYGLRYGLDALRREGIEPTQIRLTGGGSKSKIWREIIANVFNCYVVCPVVSEAGALGAALQALWCYRNQKGDPVTMQELAERYIQLDESTMVEPDVQLSKNYQDLYQNYLQLTKTLYSYS